MSVTTQPAMTTNYRGSKALVGTENTLVEIADITGEMATTTDGRHHGVDGVTILPVGGQCLAAEPAGRRWLGIAQEPATLEQVVYGWVLGADGALEKATFTRREIDARTAVAQDCPHGDAPMAAALMSSLASRVRLEEDHQGRMDTLVSEAHQWANDNSLCETFDDFMDEQGLARREQDFQLRVEVCATVYLTCRAATLEDAIEAIDTDEVRAEIDFDQHPYSVEED